MRSEFRRLSATTEPPAASTLPDVVWHDWNVRREVREGRQGHRAAVIWLTGLPGAGKTTIARAVERRLFDGGHLTMLLDGDQLRHGLNRDLGFSPADRRENIRRAGEVARLFFEQGAIVLCAFVSPYQLDRDYVRHLIPAGQFVEVYVQADAETCRRRDPKGLYARESSGDVRHLTGVSAPYEEPARAALTIDTRVTSVDEAVDAIVELLAADGITKAR